MAFIPIRTSSSQWRSWISPATPRWSLFHLHLSSDSRWGLQGCTSLQGQQTFLEALPSCPVPSLMPSPHQQLTLSKAHQMPAAPVRNLRTFPMGRPWQSCHVVHSQFPRTRKLFGGRQSHRLLRRWGLALSGSHNLGRASWTVARRCLGDKQRDSQVPTG